jgi:hypothetical protein
MRVLVCLCARLFLTNSLHAENKSLLYSKMVIFIVFVYSLRRLSDKIGNLYSAVR